MAREDQTADRLASSGTHRLATCSATNMLSMVAQLIRSAYQTVNRMKGHPLAVWLAWG